MRLPTQHIGRPQLLLEILALLHECCVQRPATLLERTQAPLLLVEAPVDPTKLADDLRDPLIERPQALTLGVTGAYASIEF